nr:zinc finger, CCHC-type [Tanacetum cinerariifolium]
MASSNNKTYGKWRVKDFNKEGKETIKWKNNPNARRVSTSQGTKDKSKLRCYECGEYGHFAKECTKWKDKKKDKEQEAHLIYDTDIEPTLFEDKSRRSVCDYGREYWAKTQSGDATVHQPTIFYYGESPISWSIQKQATVALSSCESEFIAATSAATQALWLKRLLSKLIHTQEEKITIQVDNKSAIELVKNPVFHGSSKHIDTKYHFIRECV